MKIKKAVYFLVVCMLTAGNITVWAQTPDSALKKPDTSLKAQKKPAHTFNNNVQQKKKNDSLATNHAGGNTRAVDSLQKITPKDTTQTDSLHKLAVNDSLQLTPASTAKIQRNILDKIMANNRFINTKDEAVYFLEEERTPVRKEFLFYSLCAVVLILGVFKTFFSGYFNNLFRVFFNTSLRQTQLTDQLLQAKLPSLILNIFFAVTAGTYIWLLFVHFNPPRLLSIKMLLPFCMAGVAVIYFIKYCFLKFMGWVSDIQQITDNYIFVIFLVNKITGILLVPFIIVLAFARANWIPSVATISALFLGLFFLSRYIKSYGVIEKKIPLNPFHFIIYVTGAEIVPLLILYKVAIDYVL